MGLVVNDTVKMEWQTEGWLQTSARKGRKATFIMASQNYETNKYGRISVCFTSTTAFLIVDNRGCDDIDIWTAQDVIGMLKRDMPDGFPYCFDNYVPIIESGESECVEGTLAEFDLTPYKDDIEKRMKDIAPFGYETDFKM